MRRCRKVLGFTFVEILATLTFVAIVLPVVMRGISLAASSAGETRRRTQATALCQRKMAELAIFPDLAQYPTLSGEFEDSQGFRWESQLADWQETDLKELVVRVKWDSRRGERSVELATLIFPGAQGQ